MCPKCGHRTAVRMNVAAGSGRVYCPGCGWDDSRASVSPGAPEVMSQGLSDPQKRSGPVQIVGGGGQGGVETLGGG